MMAHNLSHIQNIDKNVIICRLLSIFYLFICGLDQQGPVPSVVTDLCASGPAGQPGHSSQS